MPGPPFCYARGTGLQYDRRMSSPATEAREAVERCYAVFADYPLPKTLVASPLRNPKEILEQLSATPLRELREDQLGPYASWAMTTVGTSSDYRHFLPRILELSVFVVGWLGLEPEIIAGKLDYAAWRDWPSDERSCLRDVFRLSFGLAVESHPEHGPSAESWLCALLRLREPPEAALGCWRASRSAHAALQIASFIIKEGKHLRRHGEVRGGFWNEIDQAPRQAIAHFLLSEDTRRFLETWAPKVPAEDRFYLVEAALAELDRPS